MSKVIPIAAGPDDEGRAQASRAPSLVERAAEAYDFGAAFRGPGMPNPPPVSCSVEPLHQSPLAAGPVIRPPVDGRYGAIDLAVLSENGFIPPDTFTSSLAEEFRIVKRQLLRDADGLDHGRTILICSARPNEGKTFCSINLALSLAAEKDTDVILVDADVAKPDILSTLGLEDGPGLMDAILDPAVDVEACLIRTNIAGLFILPAGRRSHEATELLASDRTRHVLERLRSRDPRRVILFDSPPALEASPASVLAMQCGQLVFVVRADSSTESDLREALDLLSACPNPQLLLNGVVFGAANRRFGRYYGIDA